MQQEPSSAILVPLITTLTTTAQQQADSPQLGQSLLAVLLDLLPQVGGAALLDIKRSAAKVIISQGKGLPAQLEYMLPSHAVLLSGDTVVIPAESLGLSTGQAALIPFTITENEQPQPLALLAHTAVKQTFDAAYLEILQAATHVLGLALNQHQTIQALAEQRSFLRQVLDVNPNFIFAKDWEGHLILVNQAMADAYHTTPEDMFGKTGFELNPPEEAARYLADDQAVMTSGERLSVEEPNTDLETGEVRWMHTIKMPFKLGGGEVPYMLGIAIDITERKRLMLQIEESLIQRGREVDLVTETAQEIAAATNLDDLFERVVTLVKEGFGYYHTQIFRHDTAAQRLMLVQGYGPIGAKMLSDGHFLPLQRGVVGTAADTGKSVLVADVTADSVWVPHPDLPNTRGELAVPIVLRGEVLGILDVQSDTAGTLTLENQLLLEGLCGQIATAIESTRLLEEANIFRRVFEVSGEGIGISDMQGQMVYANQALADLFGITPEEAQIMQPISTHVPPEQQIVAAAAMTAVMADGQWAGEMDLQTANGEIIPTMQNIALVRDEEGNPLYILNQVADVSERRAFEQQLAEDQTLLRTVIDNLPDSIFVKDRDSRFLLNNVTHAVKILGTEGPEACVGKTDFDFFSKDFAEAYFAAEQELMRTGEPLVDVEHMVVTTDGSKIWHLNNKLPLRNVDGEIIGLVGTARDITARRQFEAQLHEERTLAETLAEISLTLTAQADTDAILEQILAYGRRLIPHCSAVSIALIDRGRLRIERWIADEGLDVSSIQVGRELSLESLPRSAGAAQSLQPVLIPDVTKGHHPGLQMLNLPWVKGYIILPINLRTRIHGIVWVASDTADTLTQDDVTRLLPLVNAAAVALENARLLQEAQQRATREERLNEIGVQLQESSDLNMLLNTALQELGDSLGAQVGRVRLTLPNEKPKGRANGEQDNDTWK